MKSMLAKAVPLTANELFFSIGTSLVFKSYMRADELLVAAISVVDTVMNLAFIVFGGLSSAVAIFIAESWAPASWKRLSRTQKKSLFSALWYRLCWERFCSVSHPIFTIFILSATRHFVRWRFLSALRAA